MTHDRILKESPPFNFKHVSFRGMHGYDHFHEPPSSDGWMALRIAQTYLELVYSGDFFPI